VVSRVRTAAITNLGCKVNQAEMESAARLFRERGVAVVDGDGHGAGSAPADLVLVNTCTVTATADQKSRQAVRRARRSNPDADIVVTGCSVQVGRDAFAAADPAARLVDNRAKDGLIRELAELLGADADADAGARDSAVGARRLERPLPTLSGVEIDGVADGRASVERTRAFIKVQDGCSFFCTYCIIPAARGPERSLSPETVVADVRRALRAGHREIVLTGINIGTYDGGWSERGFRGAHTRSALTLAGLVRRLLDQTPVERLRLSSIEPQHVDDELLRVWSDGAPRTLPHFHLPLQSGDDGVLRRMGRRYLSAEYRRTVAWVRAVVPGAAVHADVIAGFPTEDDAAWDRSVDFIRSLDFAGIHVFRYSARPGTAAIRMAGQVDERTKRRRAGQLLAVAAEARARWAAGHVGVAVDVLFEEQLPDGRWVGHAEDHTLVGAIPPGASQLDNAIGRVEVQSVDPEAPDRVVGRLVAISRSPLAPPSPLAPLMGGAHAG
jgi:threonylcarbamoyladenosine tRNA methylthiotransferase MtaB